MVKGISGKQLENKKFKVWDFEGKWYDSFGKPAKNMFWIIWGDSGNGKTDFCVQLAKYFTHFGRVAYISSEEGISRSLQIAFQRNNMRKVGSKIMVFGKMTLAELYELLEVKKYKIYVIDSLNDLGMSSDDLQKLKDKIQFNDLNKTIIVTTWADGKLPKSGAGQVGRYLASMKVHVDKFVAFVGGNSGGSRMGGGKVPFLIWKEGAEPHHAFVSQGGYEDEL